MSIWDYVFDSDYRQRSDIEQLKDVTLAQSRESKNQVEKSKHDIADLKSMLRETRKELAEQHLFNQALLAQLRKIPEWDEEAFRQTLQEGDLFGILDTEIPVEIDEDMRIEGMD